MRLSTISAALVAASSFVSASPTAAVPDAAEVATRHGLVQYYHAELAPRQISNIKPKVFIVSMFDPEAEVWWAIPEFDLLAKNVSVPGFSPLFPEAHCTSDGEICQLVTGEGGKHGFQFIPCIHSCQPCCFLLALILISPTRFISSLATAQSSPHFFPKHFLIGPESAAYVTLHGWPEDQTKVKKRRWSAGPDRPLQLPRAQRHRRVRSREAVGLTEQGTRIGCSKKLDLVPVCLRKSVSTRYLDFATAVP